MIHNGIEYGMMQAWLLDLTTEAVRENPGMTDIDPYVPDSGEGRWMRYQFGGHAIKQEG